MYDIDNGISHLAKLPDKLPTHPTGAGWRSDVCGHRKGTNIPFLGALENHQYCRSALEGNKTQSCLNNRSRERYTLRTRADWIGCVLYIGPLDDLTVHE